MFKLAALVVTLAVAVTSVLGAPPSKSTPLPPSATLFSGDYSFSTVGTTYSVPVSVPVDGAWLTGKGAWNYSSNPDWDCSHSYTGTLAPNRNDYAPLFIAGWQPDRICTGQFPLFGCLTCGVAFGGQKAYPGNYMTTSNTPGFMAAGTGTITLRSNNSGGQSDLLTFFFVDQINRDAMVNMTIRQSVDEENPTPASDTEVAERYFIANSADRIPVVPIFHYGTESNGADRQFPAGPGIVWSATWDSGAVTTVEEKFASQGLHGHSILAVSIPTLTTGKHTFTVKGMLPSGKTYTSQAMSVFIYAQNIYITVEGDFKPKAPVDQAPQFIPGSALNGTNLDLRTTPQMVQLNILIGGGSSGTFNVKLSNVSRYPGITMNYPLNSTDTNPDMDFGAGDLELFDVPIPKGGAPKVVKLPLYIYDYAASATIEVTMPYRKTTFVTKRRIPLDVDGNKLPDNGWYITSGHISATGLAATADRDQEDANGPGGDGLSVFEEFRGFVVAGGYVRLNPNRRDLFVAVDPLFLVNYNIVNGLTPLPLSIQYVTMDEVKGETYAPRNLKKIKAVVNPNRSGIPGARSDGQRAIRLIFQNQQYPHVTAFIPTLPSLPPEEKSVEVWQTGIFGATILEGVDLSSIDRTISGQHIVQIIPQSPDGTQFVEFYERTFSNAGMYTEFDHAAYHDTNGNVVPRCTTSDSTDPNYVDPETCDDWDLANFMIVPHRLPGDYFTFHTVPEVASEFFTVPAYGCNALDTRVTGGHTAAQMQELRRALALHEMGHSMHMTHARFDCGDLMYDTENTRSPRRAMPDVVPVTTTFSSYDILQIFLWQ